MRIGLNSPHTAEISANRTSTSPASTQSTSTTSQVDKFSGDKVSMSSLAGQALQLPEVRQDRVDSLRQQIASGTYRVDPQSIADAMLSH